MAEDRDLELHEEDYIRLDENREEHWRYIAEEGDNKKKIHSLRREVYVKKKEDLIKI